MLSLLAAPVSAQNPAAKHWQEAPTTHPASVFEQALGREVAPRRNLPKSVRIRQTAVTAHFPVLDRRLGPLLVIENEIQGQPCSTWPLWMGRMLAIADEIAFPHVAVPRNPTRR